MIGTTTMTISKEQMIAIVEYYLNDELFMSALHTRHKAKVVDQIRKTGDRFVIIFEGEAPKHAERPKSHDADLSRSPTEANEGATPLLSEDTLTQTVLN